MPEEPFQPVDPSPVGAWIYTGSEGLSSATNESVSLILGRDGQYRRFVEIGNGQAKTNLAWGSYAVTNALVDAVTTNTALRFDRIGPDHSTDTVPFMVKGRALFLREADPYGDGAHWGLYYRKDTVSVSAPVAANTTNVLGLLQTRMSVGGSLITEIKEFRTWNSSGTYCQWTLDLTVTNLLPFDVSLGHNLIIAQLSEDGLPSGYLRIRGAEPGRTNNPSYASYFLDDFDSTDGGRTIYIQGARLSFPSGGHHPLHAGFGQIRRRSTYVFYEEVRPGTWLKPENVAGLQVVLPELVVSTPAGIERFQPIVSFVKGASTDNRNIWQARKTEFVPVDPSGLREIINSPDAVLFKKILAVNWLTRADSRNAGRMLAEDLSTKSQGSVLAVALLCCSEQRLSGFESRAVQLEDADDIPIGIWRRATDLLDAMKVDRGLVCIASSTNAPSTSPTSSDYNQTQLDERNWMAVRFVAPTEMTITRVHADFGGPASNQKLILHMDRDGLPGERVQEFQGGGGEFRGRAALRPGQVCWFIVSRTSEQPGLASWWPRCETNVSFTACAASHDGGKSWQQVPGPSALQATVWYKRMK
jgi:hypothetical protein